MGPLLKAREMAWESLYGETAKFTKDFGRKEKRMDMEYGSRLGEITMKAPGKITIKMEKAASIIQDSLFIEDTFLNLSRMAMGKRSSQTKINILDNTLKENPMAMGNTFGKTGITMKEIFLVE